MSPRRILLTGCPAYGHLLPMLPLVRAAQRAGHDVRVATGPDLAPVLRARGVRTHTVGPTWLRAAAAARASLADVAEPGHADLVAAAATHLFGRAAAARLPGLQTLTTCWRPDVVVHEPLELAGPQLARWLGVPGVTHGFGPLVQEYDALAPLAYAASGAPELWAEVRDQLWLDVCPPGLKPPGDPLCADTWPLRPHVGESAGGLLPGARRSGRPLVYLTFGTLAAPAVDRLAAVLGALRSLPVDLVVTTGPAVDPARLGPQPAHVRVAAYLPQAEVLTRADLLVSHAGAGTALGALGHGVPQVCLPMGADQPWNAAAVERSGAGLRLVDPSPDEVAEAATTALTDPAYAAAARSVRREIESMPSAGAVLPALLQRLLVADAA